MTPDEMSDRMEIDDLLTRYATGLDQRDWDLWQSCFTSDALIDYTASGGIRGRLPEVRSWLESVMPMFRAFQHLVTNREVSIDGDVATSRAAFFNPMVVGGEAASLFFEGGYYCDRLVRTDQGWRIAERVEESVYSTRFMPILPPRP